MSPHFGLMDESQLSKEEAMLMRSKLHWRGGKRRILEDKNPEGIATLYDALLSIMRWHVLTRYIDKLGDNAEEKLEDDEIIIAILRQEGMIDDSLNLTALEKTVHRALQGEDVSDAGTAFLATIQELLTKLELLPFDETELPPEDPETY